MGKTNYEEELKKEIEVWEEMKNKYNHLLDLEKPKKKEMAEISLEFYRLSERKPLIEAELKGFQKAKEQYASALKEFREECWEEIDRINLPLGIFQIEQILDKHFGSELSGVKEC